MDNQERKTLLWLIWVISNSADSAIPDIIKAKAFRFLSHSVVRCKSRKLSFQGDHRPKSPISHAATFAQSLATKCDSAEKQVKQFELSVERFLLLWPFGTWRPSPGRQLLDQKAGIWTPPPEGFLWTQRLETRVPRPKRIQKKKRSGT